MKAESNCDNFKEAANRLWEKANEIYCDDRCWEENGSVACFLYDIKDEITSIWLEVEYIQHKFENPDEYVWDD